MIDNNPLVSIVCTTYNHQDYIRETLDGFLSQKIDFPIEIIVHDDASTDSTPQIIKEYEQKYPGLFVCVYREKNWYSQGKDIWGYLFSNVVRGKYIAICEGDDYWIDSHKLQEQVDFLERNEDYGMVYTKVEIYNNTLLKMEGTFGEITSLKLLLKGYNVIPTPSVCIRKKIYSQYVQDVNPAQKGWMIGDYPLCLYFLAKSKVQFINKETAVYRILQESASHSKDQNKLLPYYDNIMEIKKFFYDNFIHNDPRLLESINYSHFILMMNLYIQGGTYELRERCLLILPLVENVISFKKYLYVMYLNSSVCRFLCRLYRKNSLCWH